MHMIPVGADLQELELIASLDPQTDVSQRLVDRRIEHGSSIFGWKHQVVEQNRNVMALVDVEAHPRDLRRKRRGMHPKGFKGQVCHPVRRSDLEDFQTRPPGLGVEAEPHVWVETASGEDGRVAASRWQPTAGARCAGSEW